MFFILIIKMSRLYFVLLLVLSILFFIGFGFYVIDIIGFLDEFVIVICVSLNIGFLGI